MTDDIEQMREKTERKSRLEEVPDREQELVDDLTTVLSEIEAGELRKTIAVRDKPVAALLTVLDENPDAMTEVGQALQETLDRETSDNFDRSEIARLVFRVGLQEAVPEYMDQLQEAHAEHMKDQL